MVAFSWLRVTINVLAIWGVVSFVLALLLGPVLRRNDEAMVRLMQDLKIPERPDLDEDPFPWEGE
jgi:hypothetical protein